MAKKKKSEENAVPNTRIELSIVEYNSMIDRSHALEEMVLDLEKKLAEKNNVIEKLGDVTEFLMNSNWWERMMDWKQTVKKAMTYLE